MVSGNSFDHKIISRLLIAGQLVLQVLRKRLSRCVLAQQACLSLRTCTQSDYRNNLLSQRVIGQSDHCGLQYLRVRQQLSLDLQSGQLVARTLRETVMDAGVMVVVSLSQHPLHLSPSTDLDYVRGVPPQYLVVAILQLRDVSRLEPPLLVKALRRSICPIQVLPEHVGPLYAQLARALTHLLSVVVDQPAGDVGQRLPHAALLTMPLVGVRESHAHLRHAVTLQQPVARKLLPAAQHAVRQSCAAAGHQTHTGERRHRCSQCLPLLWRPHHLGVLQQPRVHSGHRHEECQRVELLAGRRLRQLV
mmetsp:Transcript_2441/g.5185  ORF Transcript_2441/g.5185 Transcript_2441/m.5185 type:complete len:305 (+) Transcript_2441:267-1181(+)